MSSSRARTPDKNPPKVISKKKGVIESQSEEDEEYQQEGEAEVGQKEKYFNNGGKTEYVVLDDEEVAGDETAEVKRIPVFYEEEEPEINEEVENDVEKPLPSEIEFEYVPAEDEYNEEEHYDQTEYTEEQETAERFYDEEGARNPEDEIASAEFYEDEGEYAEGDPNGNTDNTGVENFTDFLEGVLGDLDYKTENEALKIRIRDLEEQNKALTYQNGLLSREVARLRANQKTPKATKTRSNEWILEPEVESYGSGPATSTSTNVHLSECPGYQEAGPQSPRQKKTWLYPADTNSPNRRKWQEADHIWQRSLFIFP